MFTEYLKISLSHSYKIHQNLQPPPRFLSPPLKGQPPPCMPKISQPPPNGKFPKITSPPLQPGGVETMQMLRPSLLLHKFSQEYTLNMPTTEVLIILSKIIDTIDTIQNYTQILLVSLTNRGYLRCNILQYSTDLTLQKIHIKSFQHIPNCKE